MESRNRTGMPLLLSIALAALGPGIHRVAAAGDIAALDQHFNRPGHALAPWMFVPAGNIKEFSTAEHPGLATIYEAGRGQDIKGILKDPIRIGDYRLPWEFQTSLVQSFNLTAGGSLTVRFPREVPESILSAKPLGILIQCLDDVHVRLGFRARPEDPWFLSETCDVRQALGGAVGAFGMHCWSTTTGRMYGAGPGGPMYQKFLVDYVRYRYGLSTPPEPHGRGR
jgi:hypothetical protein